MKKKAASLFCVNHQIKIIIQISVDQYQYFFLFLLKKLELWCGHTNVSNYM